MKKHMKTLRLLLLALAALLSAGTMLATFSPAQASAAALHKGVDFAWHQTLDPRPFKEKGVEFVVRYLAGNRWPDKEISAAEADLWSKAGVNVVLVWETTAGRATEGYQAGYQDASEAFPQAAAIGMPAGRPVYFAVDVDVNGPAVRDYFEGIYDWARANFADGLATPRIGIYGGYEPVKWIRDAGYADYGWQTAAWMRGHGWLADAMQQHIFEAVIDGTNVDWNRVAHDDYGQWLSTRVVAGTNGDAEATVATATAQPAADAPAAAARPAAQQGSPAPADVAAPLEVATPADISAPAEVLPADGVSALEVVPAGRPDSANAMLQHWVQEFFKAAWAD